MNINLLVVLIILVLLFGGGAHFGGWGGPVYGPWFGYGGIGIGTVLIVMLICVLFF